MLKTNNLDPIYKVCTDFSGSIPRAGVAASDGRFAVHVKPAIYLPRAVVLVTSAATRTTIKFLFPCIFANASIVGLIFVSLLGIKWYLVFIFISLLISKVGYFLMIGEIILGFLFYELPVHIMSPFFCWAGWLFLPALY